MKKLLWAVIGLLLAGLASVDSHAQLKPGTEVGFAGVTLWQELGNNYSGSVNCIKGMEGNERKGPICKMFPKLNGTLDICNGKVQALSYLADLTTLEHVDRSFNQAVSWTDEDFGKPSVITQGEADWNLGDVQVMVHEVYSPHLNEWGVFMDVFSPRSLRPAFGCTADNSGKYGKVVDK